MAESSDDQIAEYEAQLAGIEELLQASPDDESLLALKKDLVELLALTKADNATTTDNAAATDNTTTETSTTAAAASEETAASSGTTALPPPPPPSEEQLSLEQAVTAGATMAATAATSTATKPKTKKKDKKITIHSEFVVPPHLIAKDTDSEQEKNRKHKQLKKLKNKFRHEKKEAESNHKQKSWQSFQKKKGFSSGGKRKKHGDGGKGGSSSIFSTSDGVTDRVGVVSKKTMTDFSARKRHKHQPPPF